MSGDFLLQVNAPPTVAVSAEAQELLVAATEPSELLLRVNAPPIAMSVESNDILVSSTEGVELSVSATESPELALNVEVNELVLGLPGTGGGGSGAGFLPVPDLLEDTNAIYFYFGWSSVSGSWLVRRQTRADSSFADATIGDNGTHADLASAWAVKEGLVYS